MKMRVLKMMLSFLLALICTCLVVRCISADKTGSIFKPNRCSGGMDLVFLLDTSGSIGRRHFQKMLDLVIGITSRLAIGQYATQVGVEVFSTRAATEIRLKDHNNIYTLRSAIRKIRYRGGMTNTYLGLDRLRLRSFTSYYGDRRRYPNVAIVMTDGNSQYKKKTLNAAKLVRLYGIEIIAIGIGGIIDWDEIDGIGGKAFSRQASKAIRAESFSTLVTKSFQKLVFSRVCRRA